MSDKLNQASSAQRTAGSLQRGVKLTAKQDTPRTNTRWNMTIPDDVDGAWNWARELERENNALKESARRAAKLARNGRYSAENLMAVASALDELERLSA